MCRGPFEGENTKSDCNAGVLTSGNVTSQLEQGTCQSDSYYINLKNKQHEFTQALGGLIC